MAVAQRDPFETFDQSLAAAVARVAPSVLHLARHHGGGSALVWRDDLAVTSSFHCPDEPEVSVSEASGELSPRKAEVVGRDPGLDLALLRLPGGGLVVPPHRDASSVVVGNLALAIGRPGRSPRASLRMISVRGAGVRTPTGGTLEHYLETDRQIPRGFAGGPLVDVQGAVIGMSTRTLLRGHDLAISVADIERSVALLLAHGAVPRGYLGVGVAPVVLARALHALGGSGVVVNLLDQKLWNPNPDHFSYTLSKAALLSATTMLAQALAPRVRVCGVAPGVTLPSGDMDEREFAASHRLTPLQRSSTPEDIARAVRFLLESPAITGTTLLVDGGQHLQAQPRDVMFLVREASAAAA